MGTEITLELAGLTLSWSKNSRGTDHGALFQEADRKRVRSDGIDYQYFADRDDAELASMEMAFSRRLRDTTPRLELLGHTLERVRSEYDAAAAYWRERKGWDEDAAAPDLMSFEEFCSFVQAHPVSQLDDTFNSSLDDHQIRGRFADDPLVARLPGYSPYDNNAYSERSYFGSLINILQPYSVLRVLALNPDNAASELVWNYGLLVESGWATPADFISCAGRRQTFLIATEGSSDTHILKHAFEVMRPEISDFFRFIDVSESHPFAGTGNLVKFAEGLAKIDVHNQIVCLFDNDAEGLVAHRRLAGLTLPANMRSLVLPDLEEFRTFRAKGPAGIEVADINGRAAAIECYLDLRLDGRPPAHVVWTNYKPDLDAYHGALAFKETYARHFLDQPAALGLAGYDTSKLGKVLNYIVSECSSISGSEAAFRDVSDYVDRY